MRAEVMAPICVLFGEAIPKPYIILRENLPSFISGMEECSAFDL